MNVRTLVDAAALQRLLGRDDVLVVDCRCDLADPQRGRRDWLAGHIPGAVHADLNDDLSELCRPGQGRHPLPDAAAFSAVLSRWGWTPHTTVVAYDAAGGALAAARLWWMLRLCGHDASAVLDGGFQAWTSAQGRLETGETGRTPSHVQVVFDARQIVDHAELEHPDAPLVLLDARAAARFRGELEPIDAVAGHVPGAVNRPFGDNLAQGRFKPAAQLRTEFAALLGNVSPRDVVHMCGSGVTACSNLLAMEHAGLTGSRIYAPSWSGWISDPARPVAREAG